MESSGECGFICTPKTQGGKEGTILGHRHTHFPYRGMTPPRNWRHKKFECSKIHIWSWWCSRRSMTHAKKNPRTPTKERPNMVPLDAIWFITFRRPERMMTLNRRVTSHKFKNSKKFKIQKIQKIYHVSVHLQSPCQKYKNADIFRESIDTIINSHIPPLFYPLLQIQWERRPVLTQTQSKSIKILIFLFTTIFFISMFFLTLKILNVWFKKDA